VGRLPWRQALRLQADESQPQTEFVRNTPVNALKGGSSNGRSLLVGHQPRASIAFQSLTLFTRRTLFIGLAPNGSESDPSSLDERASV
jgi:hypothetical protein